MNMDIKILIEIRNQINEDIKDQCILLENQKLLAQKAIELDDFDGAAVYIRGCRETTALLNLMLEQNLTFREAQKIIDAQSEEPAAAEPKQEEPKQEEPKQEEPEQFAGLNLTEKETATLNALIKGLYAEVGFTDVSDLDLVNETGIPAKSMRGVLSSLSKKGIIDVDTSLVESINKQKKMQNEPKVEFNSFINLAEEYYNLHPEWAAEIAENA